MSSIADKDKDREQLLAELEELRAEVSAIRRRDDARRSAELFFNRFSEAMLQEDDSSSGNNSHISTTVEIFQKLLENFPNGSINIFDKDLRYLFAAGKGLEQAELFADHLVGKSLFELYPREDAEHAATYYKLALEGRSVSFELPFQNRLYIINAAPLEDKSGNIYAVIAVAQDITKRKQAEAVIEDRERRLNLIYRSVADCLFVLSVEPEDRYSFISVNEAFLTVTGFKREEVVGKRIEEVLPPTSHSIVRGKYLEAIRNNKTVRWEETALMPAGRRVGEVFVTPVRDEIEGRLYLLGGVHDITERTANEEALHEMEQRAIREYEHLLERLTHLAESFGQARDLVTIFRALREFATASVPCIGIFISLYDPSRDVRTAVYAWGDGEEFDVSQLPPMPITTEGPNSRAVRTGQIIITDDYSKVNHGVQTVAIGANDEILPLSSMAAPMSVMGRIVGTIEVQSYERAAYKAEHVAAMRMAANLAAVAIENVRLFEHERLARAVAEDSNRIKDEFLATLSHELRTPLTAVLGWTRLLRERGLDEKTSIHALDIIERNAQAQKQIIEEILDVSRIITGKTKLDVRPITLERVIEAAIETVRPAADAREIVLEFVRRGGEHALISGDAERLQQVFWNLLSNAVKFTPRGGRIDVSVAQVDSHAQIEVRDSGEGISPDFLPYVFDRFRQADGSTTRPHGGLGLGLAIVRHLVELHGGTVRAESDGENQGSTFYLKLPMLTYASEGDKEIEGTAARVVEGNREPDGLPSLEGLRVLVVDDEPDALEFLRVILERSRAEVAAVSSTDEALLELERFRPDVIISDIGMPGRDGYDFVRALRALPTERGGKLPAIALTAYARSEDEKLALREGFQIHIAKPFEPAQLLNLVATLGKERDEII